MPLNVACAAAADASVMRALVPTYTFFSLPPSGSASSCVLFLFCCQNLPIDSAAVAVKVATNAAVAL